MSYVHVYLQIPYDVFNFHVYNEATLKKLEDAGSFPPRFIINYPNVQLSSRIIISTDDNEMMFYVGNDSIHVEGIW